jgi:GNAT superfamily N-acetyltransferase
VAELVIRPVEAADRELVAGLLERFWGATTVVAHGTVIDASTLPGLVAERAGAVVGLLTYRLDGDGLPDGAAQVDGAGNFDRAGLPDGDGLEVVTIDADPPHGGAGSALLAAAREVAVRAGARRLWLVTTNDNLDGLRFYQRRGLRLIHVSPGALDAARQLKPSIPQVGAYGIPLRDELTLELLL